MERYIDADKLKDVISQNEGNAYCQGCNNALKAVMKNAKTKDVAPIVHAKWVATANIKTSLVFCTNCKQMQAHKSNYCPHCGAKMDGKPTQ